MVQETLRVATLSDLPALVDIYNDVIAEGGFTADLSPYTVEERRPWFNEHQQEPFQIYLLERDNQVLGYISLSRWRGGRAATRQVAEVSYYLAREARGRGLGQFMLEQAQRIAARSGITSQLAILLDINIGSRTLLEKNDFTLAGRLPDIADLGKQRCGQLIMLKKL